MNLLERLGRSRLILGAIGAVSALILAFIPLFNLTGYESAAFYGVFYGITLSYLSFDALDEAAWAEALALNLALLAPPFAILSLNALRVPNCDFGTGAAFWLAIPVMSIALATTLAWVVGNYLPERRKFRRVVITLVILATVVDFGLRLALQPPIIGFHVFLGYFSGSIYDEALSLPGALVAYRIGHVFLIGVFVATVTAHRHRATRGRLPVGWAATSVVFFMAMTYMAAHRHEHGIDLTRSVIAERLGGKLETEHFIIFYPAESPFTEDIDRIAEDHEFRYAEMKEYFGTDPVALHGEKVRSFVYPDRDRKGALMGARRTLVAKIWLREIHILWRYYGDHMLAHELAHVFTEPFGNGPLRLSALGGVLPNMGIVEGIATAADWDAESLNPHEASAALRKMDAAPDITALVGMSGFWTQSSGRAYTLMGSFVRWLVETYGIEKFRQAYPNADLEGVYGKAPAELVDEWGAFVDAIELSDAQLERARYTYDRKSIFQKVCARTIAELQVDANREFRAGRREAARELYREIIAFDPDNPDYRINYARFLVALSEYDEAQNELERLLAGELDEARSATALSLLGDIFWLSGEPGAAADRYARCLETGLPVASERLLRVKAEALRRTTDETELARLYLLDDVTDAVRLYFPSRWISQHPGDPLANYLVGRRLWSARQWKFAEPHLWRALDAPQGVLRDEATVMLVETLHFQGEADGAVRVLESWEPTDGHYEILKEEWTRRVDWKSRNTIDAQGR